MFRRIAEYLKSVRVEMNKVTWPSREQLVESTGITLLLSLVLAIFVFLADMIISRLINLLI
ncbi:MAG TPA: preprotein translocase subunit SecE [Bacteroidetes bacterium]|nr:preprotein translocase subunit SecE [Bacteroidota bacterium]